MAFLVRRALRWALGRRVPDRYARVRVVNISPVAPKRAHALTAPLLGESFSLKNILLAVTLLNASIFIGGSVYTGITVTSIQEKYEKAQTEIGESASGLREIPCWVAGPAR